ncbi:MAG: 16S rRNA (cytosine(967)-C(5))-methyltransferase RsmB [Firmicutes bacterium]|jgi:16S rRNA (cytosine967-C5)-methyltransferase|nr:16S rRNA (cytosine(967)-C(5))-methyltransferase RsmB [Bacillota bacterium]
MAATLARRIAVEVLESAERRKSYVNLALNSRLTADLTKEDRARITDLVYGTSRHLGTIDRHLAPHCRRRLQDLPGPIRAILRLALYEILYTQTPPPVAVDQAVELAKIYGHRGTASLVNGVLRSLLRKGIAPVPSLAEDPIGHIAITHAHPPWLVARWVKRFGAEFAASLCRANNEPAPTTIRVNTLLTTRERLASDLAERGIDAAATALSPHGLSIKGFDRLADLDLFTQGHFTVQDESSMLVAPALEPQSGDFIVDLCGGPGGKTTHLAELMENRGRILALDIHRHKLALLQQTCQRLGIQCVEPLLCDARYLLEKRPELAGQVQHVLIDAPCSGLGVLRRRPDARWRKAPGEPAALAKLQRELLTIGMRLLAKGGRLVYSTCSFEPEETLDNVAWLLANFSLRPVDLADLLNVESAVADPPGTLTLFPHTHGTDGFFLAAFDSY